jgi:Fur family ferric uptake transcriptional regulator
VSDVSTHYCTDGKELLLAFLREHADTPCTIEEIAAALPTGKSTLYRLMTALVADGTVRRFVRGNSRQFTYQPFGGEDCHAHLHLKCVDCGRVVHLDHDVSEYVEERLLRQNHFATDEVATMLWGRCEGCACK